MVEIKFVFADADLQKAQDLGWLSALPTVRTVAFFDTAKHELLDGTRLDSELTVILRARFSPEKDRGVTTLKIRTAGTLDKSLKTDVGADAKRESDLAYGRKLLTSYSLDSKQDRGEIEEVFDGHRPVKSIFSSAQEACIDRELSGSFPWADLRIFGPVKNVEVWDKTSIASLERLVTFERWSLRPMEHRSARQILELSARAPNKERRALVEEMLGVLRGNGINPSASETKTKTVLEHFRPRD